MIMSRSTETIVHRSFEFIRISEDRGAFLDEGSFLLYAECTKANNTLVGVPGREEYHMAMDMLSCKPIYEQIYDKIKILILSGAVAADEQIPSVRSMAIELAVNPNTVQKAYTMLEEDGLVYVVKGRGNFASGGDKIRQLKRTFVKDKAAILVEEAGLYGIEKEELLKIIREIQDV